MNEIVDGEREGSLTIENGWMEICPYLYNLYLSWGGSDHEEIGLVKQWVTNWLSIANQWEFQTFVDCILH